MCVFLHAYIMYTSRNSRDTRGILGHHLCSRHPFLCHVSEMTLHSRMRSDPARYFFRFACTMTCACMCVFCIYRYTQIIPIKRRHSCKRVRSASFRLTSIHQNSKHRINGTKVIWLTWRFFSELGVLEACVVFHGPPCFRVHSGPAPASIIAPDIAA